MSADNLIENILLDLANTKESAISAAETEYERNMKYLASRADKLRELYVELSTEDDEDKLEDLEVEAAEIAEELEIEFVYTRADGEHRSYYPEAWWEPSGGCSWVESAQYGSDYGWNVF